MLSALCFAVLSACGMPSIEESGGQETGLQAEINHVVQIENCEIRSLDGKAFSEEDLEKKIESFADKPHKHAVYFKFDSADCPEMVQYINDTYFPLSQVLRMGTFKPVLDGE